MMEKKLITQNIPPDMWNMEVVLLWLGHVADITLAFADDFTADRNNVTDVEVC